MARNNTYTTSGVPTKSMGQVVDELCNSAKSTRQGHERRWYDNNFFDDGYHFRYLSRSEGKIIDLSEKASINNPIRAIPKASRQVRGIANLLISNDLVPIVYPEKVEKKNYSEEPIGQDPQTGKPISEFDLANKMATMVARRTGHWITEESKNQEISEKLSHMIILAAKHSVSYLKVWPDAVKESIDTTVRDAFDLFVLGNYTELGDLPFLVEATPHTIAEIKANENYDEDQLTKINPDNRHASSEVKEAYMKSRFGGRPASDESATLILKEAFIKEYLNDENSKIIKKQEDGGDIIKKRDRGDPVFRHVFSAGGVWLRDEYLDITSYPYIDFRFEPGPIYQVPMIERFMGPNKSLDMIASRIEKYAHTMGVGIWLKQKQEDFNVSNVAGGQVVDYESVPPRQMNLAQLPPMFFNYIEMLNNFIEEQGVSTSTLGRIPAGVKAAKAIESLKESEYSNLVIANKQLKQTVRRIAERFLDIADDYFVTPQTVFYLEKGEPNYFDIIGASGLSRRKKAKLQTNENVIPLSKDYKVEIEVQSGLGYTREGRKAAAKELGDYLLQLAQLNLVPPAVVIEYIENLFKVYEFGSGSDVIKDIESFSQQGMMTNPQQDAMKVAMAQVLKDAGIGPQPTPEERIQETKVAVAQVIKDSGIAEKEEKGEEGKTPSRSISLKDLPPEGQVQLAGQAGIAITPDQVNTMKAKEQPKGGAK